MILIVGGAGYIGSHVNKELHKRGYDTVVYDNLIYGHREAVKWGHFEYGDLRDTNRLEQVVGMYEIDAVFHFAEFAYVDESVEKPSKYYNNHVDATLNLLDVVVSSVLRIIETIFRDAWNWHQKMLRGLTVALDN